MGLTRRDAYATAAVVVGALLALSVLLDWSWPLMNGVRAGIIGLGVTGLFACAVSGWAEGEVAFADPLLIAGIVVGVVAFFAGLVGLFAGSPPYLVFMLVAILVLWLVTMTHRLTGGARTRKATTA